MQTTWNLNSHKSDPRHPPWPEFGMHLPTISPKVFPCPKGPNFKQIEQFLNVLGVSYKCIILLVGAPIVPLKDPIIRLNRPPLKSTELSLTHALESWGHSRDRSNPTNRLTCLLCYPEIADLLVVTPRTLTILPCTPQLRDWFAV